MSLILFMSKSIKLLIALVAKVFTLQRIIFYSLNLSKPLNFLLLV